MAKSSNKNNTALFHCSLLVALLLMMLPWQGTLKLIQPYWLALVVAYWSLEGQRPMMNWAFFYGLLLDVLSGSLLGKHGMSLVALSFLISKSAKQLRITSFWQLMMMVLGLLVNDLVIRALLDWVSFEYTPQLTDCLPLFTAALIWPWMKYFLDRQQLDIKNH